MLKGMKKANNDSGMVCNLKIKANENSGIKLISFPETTFDEMALDRNHNHTIPDNRYNTKSVKCFILNSFFRTNKM